MESKEYLIAFMNRFFKDKSFTRYIRFKLAGDFAFNLADAICKIRTDNQQTQLSISQHFDKWYTNTKDKTGMLKVHEFIAYVEKQQAC
jgi:hypothetical protein